MADMACMGVADHMVCFNGFRSVEIKNGFLLGGGMGGGQGQGGVQGAFRGAMMGAMMGAMGGFRA